MTFYSLVKFDIEKQNLLDELEMLRRAREAFDQEKHLRDQELRQIRDRARASSEGLKNAEVKIQLLEQQVYHLEAALLYPSFSIPSARTTVG
jgi:hypothetical protein